MLILNPRASPSWSGIVESMARRAAKPGATKRFARRAAKLTRRAAKLARGVRRWWRPAPRPAKIIMGVLMVLILWLISNWIYQVVRKPSGALLSGERDALQIACGNLGRVRADIQKVFDRCDDAAPIGGDRPGGGIGKSRGAHLLALVVDITAIRGVSAGVERGGDVSDHRRQFCGGQALLHPRSPGRRGWILEQLAIVLVQHSLYVASIPSQRGRTDVGLSGPQRRQYSGTAKNRRGEPAAQAGTGCADPSVRRGRRR